MSSIFRTHSDDDGVSFPRRSGFRSVGQRIRALFTIPAGEASFEVRGFPESDRKRREWLEHIGQTFIAGFNASLVEDDRDKLQCFIASIDMRRRGFAVEGAAMGAAIADALSLRGNRLAQWFRCCDAEYTYLTHVGAGWALARTPWRRRAILKICDPVHRWLVFDGLGFHDAYFMADRVLQDWRRVSCGYAARAYDQGVGRALWFVAGGDVVRAVAAIGRFAKPRQSDLWAGIGLAMAYAGPVDVAEIAYVLQSCGAHSENFAQGVAFACAARVRAGHVPAHTDLVAVGATGASAKALSDLVRKQRTLLPEKDGDWPRYEYWRRDVAAAIRHLTG